MEEIIKGNALIFDFMGMEHIKDNEIIESHRMKWLSYHYEWSQLMPVVEKIEDLPVLEPHGKFGVHISSNNCTIQATNFRPTRNSAYFNDVYEGTKILATWRACLQFIDWYNAHFNNK